MRTRLITHSAVALGLGLSGCANIGTHVAEAQAHAHTGAPASKAPAASAMPAPTDLDSAVRLAVQQRKNGDLAGATRTLSQLVLVAPDDPRVLGEYGKVLLAKGAIGDALAFLNRAIELKSDDWTLYSAQGIARAQQGDYAGASKAFSLALALKPGDPVILNNDAMTRLQDGDLAGAEKLLLQAKPDDGAYPRIQKNLALVRRLKNASVSAVPAVTPAGTPGQAPVKTAAAARDEMPAVPAKSAASAMVAVETAPLAPPAVGAAPIGPARVVVPTTAHVATAAMAPAQAGQVGKPAIVEQTVESAGDYAVQVGAYSTPSRAQNVVARLEGLAPLVVHSPGSALYRVRLGPFDGRAAAEAALKRVADAGLRGAQVLVDAPLPQTIVRADAVPSKPAPKAAKAIPALRFSDGAALADNVGP